MATDRLDEMRLALKVADGIGLQLVCSALAALEMDMEQPGTIPAHEPLVLDAHYETDPHAVRHGIVMLHLLVGWAARPDREPFGIHLYVRVAHTEHLEPDPALDEDVLEALAEEFDIPLEAEFLRRAVDNLTKGENHEQH